MSILKNYLVLAAAVLAIGVAHASPVTPQRAATVAKNFYNTLPTAKAGNLLQDFSHEWQFDAIYLFRGEKGGFVLVAADDASRPILGYSATGLLDPAHMPDALLQWLQGYQRQIAVIREAQGKSCSAGAAEWYALENGLASKDSASDGVEPMLTTAWDQTYPYNALCPYGTVTGCAATAQAQVMNYWQYPAFGLGRHSYDHPIYGMRSADFGHTLYDWGHMPSMATYSSSEEEKAAVATLMYHCGVSLEMNYGTAAEGGSSAIGLVGRPGYMSIDNSLIDYFCYSRDLQVIFKGMDYSNDRWRDALIAEIDLGHPIIYVGSATQGGHGFVCDGYDGHGYMHFNFGWSGIGDGYYPVDSISPGVGGAGGNGTYTFNMNNAALLGLVPDYRMRVSDTAFNIARAATTDSLLLGVNETVDAPWSVDADAEWLTVECDTFERAGWVRFHAQENNTGIERVAVLVFRQGDEQRVVRVAQAAYDVEEMCPLTVVMESTRGDGWLGGAFLSIESEGGYVYGTARMEDGERDSVIDRKSVV